MASLFLQPIPDPDLPQLEQRLPPWAGFLDGAAVAPAYRRSQSPELNLHGELLEWRRELARESGKSALLTIARPDNIPSVRNLYANGFFALVYAPRYYGPRPEDDRMVGAILLNYPAAVSRDLAGIPVSPGAVRTRSTVNPWLRFAYREESATTHTTKPSLNCFAVAAWVIRASMSRPPTEPPCGPAWHRSPFLRLWPDSTTRKQPSCQPYAMRYRGSADQEHTPSGVIATGSVHRPFTKVGLPGHLRWLASSQFAVFSREGQITLVSVNCLRSARRGVAAVVSSSASSR